MLIVGITGTLGAGKGTISDYLIKKGFNHYSVSDYIVVEIKKRGLETNRDTMYQVGRDLKQKFGPDFIVKELYKQAKEEGKNAIIESVRSPGEVVGLKELEDFILIAVDADQKLRYQRIRLRNSVKDQIDFETFASNEAREMEDSDDPTKINLSACIKIADHVFNNNGTFEELYIQVDDVVSKL
ncbi:MAG: AAA family ATPase [Candidatus Absconditabacterales bacterium]